MSDDCMRAHLKLQRVAQRDFITEQTVLAKGLTTAWLAVASQHASSPRPDRQFSAWLRGDRAVTTHPARILAMNERVVEFFEGAVPGRTAQMGPPVGKPRKRRTDPPPCPSSSRRRFLV